MLKNKTVKNLIFFDFIFQIMYIIFFIPFFKQIFKILLEFLTTGYLTTETFNEILRSPIKLSSFLFVIMLVAILNLIEHTSFVFSFNQIRLGNELTVIEIFNNTYKIIKRKLRFKNIPILFFSLLGIPFSNLISKNMRIPEYISSHFLEKNLIILHMCITAIFFFILAIFTLYLYHIFILEGLNFKNSIVSSFKLSRRNFIKTTKIVCIILVKRFLLFLTKISILGVVLAFFYFLNDRKLRNSEILLYLTIAGVIKIILNIAINYITFSEISKLYFKVQNEINISNLEFEKNNRIKLKLSLIATSILLISFLNKYRYSIDEIRYYHNFKNLSPIISAHRGSTKKSAENTLEAVKEAINLQADFTEIDVMLTKDNVVVLCHDYNLKRLTGKNINLKNLTFEELKELKIKNHDSKEEFSFVDLETVIRESKGKIKLNIELKPEKNNHKDLAREVVKLINQDYENIVVSSLSPKALMEVKNLDDSIQCGFIIAFAYGDFYNAYFADFYAIEESYINPKIIRRIHGLNKKVLVWTTNSPNSVENAIRNGVDGIITDEIEIARSKLNYLIENEDFTLHEFILSKVMKIIR